jgi:hypothetical protein
VVCSVNAHICPSESEITLNVFHTTPLRSDYPLSGSRIVYVCVCRGEGEGGEVMVESGAID